MDENAHLEPATAAPPARPEPAPVVETGPARPAVTFMGNTYDLVSLGALGSALLTAFLCLTLNYGIYCLPFLPIILGLIGVLSARQAVDTQRTRTLSWIGLGIGVGIVLLVVLCIVGSIVMYILFFALIFATEGSSSGRVSLLPGPGLTG